MKKIEFPQAFDSGSLLEDIDKRSPDSQAMLDYWDKTDAIMGGIEAMRNAGETYLPRFPSEDKTEYSFRLTQTKMTNVYSDVIEGLAAKPFEEEVTIDNEDQAFAEFAEDVDGSGNNLTQFAAITFFNGINSAIDWIFVDYPNPETGKIRTKAEQKRAGIRPFWSRVLARNMLEAKSEIVNGREVLTLCRILEPGKPTKVRKFERDETGKINWTLYAKQENSKDGWFIEDEGTLTIPVIPLVPFITGRRIKGFLFHPAMQGAVDLQIELYQQESDLKFAKKMTAFPMLAGNGVRPEMDESGKPKRIAVGPASVLYAPSDGAGNSGTWGYVEPSASSLTFLAAEIKETKQDLRELGRQPLTAQSGNLTVITTAVAAGKSKSAVVAWALSLKDVLENAFKITAMWMKSSIEPSVTVYTEFDSFLEGEDGLDKLMEMAAADPPQLSIETLHKETKRRRYLSPEFDHDEEMERILGQTPVNPDDDET